MPRQSLLAPLVLALVAAPLPLAAQSTSQGAGQGGGQGAGGMVETLTKPSAIADAATKAADELAKKAKDSVLASEMIGRQVTGPGGDNLGTVQDLVVIPGGQVMAILVKPSGGGAPVALPYRALKVSGAAKAADQLGLSLPVSLDEARGMQGMQALTKAATGG
jgi:sporulation protein YlmC with PRC-barrel domain